MSTNQLTKILNKVFQKATAVKSFMDNNHVEFIVFKHNSVYKLIWLPTSLSDCVVFTLPMKLEKFLKEFSILPQQSRLTYVVNQFIDHSFCDLEYKKSNELQTLINMRHGLHQERVY